MHSILAYGGIKEVLSPLRDIKVVLREFNTIFDVISALDTTLRGIKEGLNALITTVVVLKRIQVHLILA